MAVLALVVGQVAAVAYFTSTSFFFYDDFIHFVDARHEGLSLGYLAKPFSLHFMPGVRLGHWLLQRYFPLDFGVAQALLLALFAGSVLALYRVLSELFGPGPGPLLLTLVYGTSIVHVDVAQWWSAGLQIMPSALLSILCILAYLRFHRTGGRRWLVASVIAVVAGLLFYIKVLLTPLYLVLLRVLVLDRDRPLRASLVGAAREWRVWGLYLVPVALYLGVYLTQYWQPSSIPALWAIRLYLQTAWARVFAPSFLGMYVPKTGSSPGDEAAVAAVQVFMAALVVASVVRRTAAWRAWAFFGLAFVTNALLVGLSRIDLFGPDVAYGLRYYVEATYLLPIALGAAFLPLRTGHAAQERRLDLPRRWRAASWGVLTLAVAAYLAVAWSGARQVMEESPGPEARAYMGKVEEGLRRIERSGVKASVVDGAVPEYVMGAWMTWGTPRRYDRYSEIFPLIELGLVFDRPAPPLFDVADDGSLRPVAFASRAGGEARRLAQEGALTITGGASERRRRAVCIGSRATSAVVEFTPATPLTEGEWYLELGYSSETPQTLLLLVDRGAGYEYADQGVRLEGGGHDAVLTGLGGPDMARMRLDLPPYQRVCLHRLQVGRLVPRVPGLTADRSPVEGSPVVAMATPSGDLGADRRIGVEKNPAPSTTGPGAPSLRSGETTTC